ncbi:hypothetical protein I316_01535 [Kwoniella heveanensis BCC8398]|uniref:Uncharacterized protein n=1 Tax=Kwoniella heveanensis BCC8398 TaxID=1296120 RepID=A0A1B9H111_9TREE|nr:hypothetical protein I316_01535 [Kwoniella heveanensis BCC8398]
MAYAFSTHSLADYSKKSNHGLAQGPSSASASSRSRTRSNRNLLLNHPDSDIIPSVIYTSLAGRQERGRSTERKIIHSSSPSPPASRRGSDADSNAASPSGSNAGTKHYHSHHHDDGGVDANTVSSHHSLPTPSDDISPNPILYLPPLLSPLPESHPSAREHERLNRAKEALKDFETRLPDIDPASLALHQALHHFKPLSEDYASTDYDQAFNWSSLTLPKSVSREWYCVVFRSRRKPESASLSLYRADREAHEEAVKNGGLVMYWYGVPDHTGMNLATCIWQSRRHAIKAISGPKHMKAMKETEGAYETYALERWVLSTSVGDKGVELRRWSGGEVGW